MKERRNRQAELGSRLSINDVSVSGPHRAGRDRRLAGGKPLSVLKLSPQIVIVDADSLDQRSSLFSLAESSLDR